MIPAADAELLARFAARCVPGGPGLNVTEWNTFTRVARSHAAEAGFTGPTRDMAFIDYLICEQRVIAAQAELRNARQTLNSLRPKEHTA